MNIRCGMDIIEIDRVNKALLRHGNSFIERVFTPEEISFCQLRGKASLQSFAARFCAKEAVSKALGTGITKGVSFKDIEIVNDENGKPIVILHNEAKACFEKMGARSIDVSLTHCRQYAAAQAVILV